MNVQILWMVLFVKVLRVPMSHVYFEEESQMTFFYAGGLKPPTSRRQNLWPHVASGRIFGRYGNHEMCIHHPRQKGKVFLLSFFGIIDDSKLVCKIWITGEEGPWTTRWVQLACLFWLYPGYPQSETGPKPELVTSRCSMQGTGCSFHKVLFCHTRLRARFFNFDFYSLS